MRNGRNEPMNVLVGNGIFEIHIGADGKIHIRSILPDRRPIFLRSYAPWP